MEEVIIVRIWDDGDRWGYTLDKDEKYYWVIMDGVPKGTTLAEGFYAGYIKRYIKDKNDNEVPIVSHWYYLDNKVNSVELAIALSEFPSAAYQGIEILKKHFSEFTQKQEALVKTLLLEDNYRVDLSEDQVDQIQDVLEELEIDPDKLKNKIKELRNEEFLRDNA